MSYKMQGKQCLDKYLAPKLLEKTKHNALGFPPSLQLVCQDMLLQVAKIPFEINCLKNYQIATLTMQLIFLVSFHVRCIPFHLPSPNHR